MTHSVKTGLKQELEQIYLFIKTLRKRIRRAQQRKRIQNTPRKQSYKSALFEKSFTNHEFNKATETKYSPILLTLPAASESVTDLSPIDIPFLQLSVRPTGVRHISCVVSLDNHGATAAAYLWWIASLQISRYFMQTTRRTGFYDLNAGWG